jgi:hypothetical protein
MLMSKMVGAFFCRERNVEIVAKKYVLNIMEMFYIHCVCRSGLALSAYQPWLLVFISSSSDRPKFALFECLF